MEYVWHKLSDGSSVHILKSVSDRMKAASVKKSSFTDSDIRYSGPTSCVTNGRLASHISTGDGNRNRDGKQLVKGAEGIAHKTGLKAEFNQFIHDRKRGLIKA